MDSLAVAELLGRIEKELGPRLALDELGLDQGSLTLDALAKEVLSASGSDPVSARGLVPGMSGAKHCGRGDCS